MDIAGRVTTEEIVIWLCNFGAKTSSRELNSAGIPLRQLILGTFSGQFHVCSPSSPQGLTSCASLAAALLLYFKLSTSAGYSNMPSSSPSDLRSGLCHLSCIESPRTSSGTFFPSQLKNLVVFLDDSLNQPWILGSPEFSFFKFSSFISAENQF